MAPVAVVEMVGSAPAGLAALLLVVASLADGLGGPEGAALALQAAGQVRTLTRSPVVAYQPWRGDAGEARTALAWVQTAAGERRNQLARYLRHGEQQWFWSLAFADQLTICREARVLVATHGDEGAALAAVEAVS